MKTVGIIAEYNPFHNGHAWQIREAKRLSGADYCIIIMSGNFVQRGTPAILDKGLRARAALLCGADLVLELPVFYACASAEYFASGAIALLDRLGVCDYLCFGSESGDIRALTALSDALLMESGSFKKTLKSRLKTGCSYPQAREAALHASAPQLAESIPLLRSPNNILGLAYLCALKKRGSGIKPCTVLRKGSGYHDDTLSEENPYASALAIRETLLAGKDILCVKEQIPAAVYELFAANYQKTFPLTPHDLSPLLFYKLIQEQADGFTKFFDIDSHFSNRICSLLPACTDYDAFCEALKTKNTTYTKVARNLLHILLSIKETDREAFCSEDFVYYARMLGFRKESAPLLSAVKANSSIPLLSKLADSGKQILSPNGVRMLEQDIQASHIFSYMLHHKFGHDFQNEYKRQIIVL